MDTQINSFNLWADLDVGTTGFKLPATWMIPENCRVRDAIVVQAAVWTAVELTLRCNGTTVADSGPRPDTTIDIPAGGLDGTSHDIRVDQSATDSNPGFPYLGGEMLRIDVTTASTGDSGWICLVCQPD